MEPRDEVRLASVPNFRDVAGAGYATATGRTMAHGVVYRSDALTPQAEDQAVLAGLGVARVVDLRTPTEIAQRPDVLPDGAEYLPIDILDGRSTFVAAQLIHELTPETARLEMAKTYRSFVTGETERARFGEVLRAIATSPGASVVHCAAGKDRTGWTAALLQYLAGVGETDVYADYLLTNERLAGFAADVLAYVDREMPEAAAVAKIYLDVDREYLDGALNCVADEFGSVEVYVREGLGLDGHLVDDLVERLQA